MVRESNECELMPKQKSTDDQQSFADAMSKHDDLKKLDRDKLAKHAPPTGPQREASASSPAASTTSTTSTTAPPTSQVAAPKASGPNRNSGAALALASRAELKKLRAGKIRPQQTIDLHGFTRDNAYRRLCHEVARATTADFRCLLVIHGKGQHSSSGAVTIRDALSDWLTQPPLAQHVAGCTLAQPRDGGSGASYLLLRRPR
ncbi:MAG: DNA-nicking Smr family endonuclease [Myxococcota bacterium]|jgi:DNA-nicking Smr family endonuclease